jgi:hypothetical protein
VEGLEAGLPRGPAVGCAGSDSVLASVDGQTRFWKLKGMGGAGPSESIDIGALATGETLAKRLVGLRHRTWDGVPTKRAVEIQEAYSELLAEVRAHQLSNTRMPPCVLHSKTELERLQSAVESAPSGVRTVTPRGRSCVAQRAVTVALPH